MITVTLQDAAENLSNLVGAVERGETVVIARDGVPVARMEAVPAVQGRQPGAWRSMPGWADYRFDPAVVAPMTAQQVAEEGWPG